MQSWCKSGELVILPTLKNNVSFDIIIFSNYIYIYISHVPFLSTDLYCIHSLLDNTPIMMPCAGEDLYVHVHQN